MPILLMILSTPALNALRAFSIPTFARDRGFGLFALGGRRRELRGDAEQHVRVYRGRAISDQSSDMMSGPDLGRLDD